MGLSAPRRRAKLSHDPNNAHWTQSSTKYGQRILESQGWKNGDAIGQQREATTNPQSVFSRLSIKEGNLGLGAKNIRGVDEEPTGLADFQDLLGRLNGKSEVSIQRTQKARGEMARHRYLERRGTIIFVRGGYMEREELKEIEPAKQDEFSTPSQKNSERGLKSDQKISRHSPEAEETPSIDTETAAVFAKAAKRQRKEERRQQKRLKQLASEVKKVSPANEVPAIAVEPAGAMVAKTAQPASNRNFVRQRYIRQKQLAMTDVKALNEILMIKP